MKKTLLGIILLLISFNLLAINHYWSSTGLNSNNGLTTSTPRQTLTQLQTDLASFSSNDSVLFKCGDTFYGTITIGRNDIKFGTYDVGAKPIITGFSTITGWANIGGNIWESTSAVTALSTLNMVVINGNNTPVGRTPNTGYYTIASHTLRTSLTSSSLDATAINWTGAEVVVRTSDFTMNRSTITSHTTNLISFSGTPMNYDIKDGYGFFLQKDIRTLDTLNEWYFNPTTKKLSVYSIGAPTNVKVSTVENLFFFNGILSNISVEGIAFEGANSNAIWRNITFTQMTDIKVKKCDINFSGLSAIELRVNRLLIDSNTINNSNEKAISTQFSKNNTITNNNIRNSGIIPGMGGNNSNAVAAVNFGSFADSRSTVMYNTITNTGQNGMVFGIDTAYIAYNRVDSVCLVLDDAACIYGFNSSKSTITRNIVSNSIGSIPGTNRTYVFAHGIYLDDNSVSDTVTYNTVFNIGGNGIVIHNTASSTINNNTVFNSKLSQMVFAGDNINGAAGRVRNNIARNNILVAKDATQNAAEFTSNIVDLDSIGTLDSNVYARPLNDILTIKFRQGSGGTLLQGFKDLANWKLSYGKDANSKTSAVTAVPYTVSNILAGNKIANGYFTANISGVNLTTTANGSSIIRDASVLDSGSLRLNCLENVTFLINTTSLVNTKQYILRFTAAANVEVNLNVTIGGITALPTKIFPFRKDYEVVFNYPATTASPTLLFSTTNNPVTLWMDNIVFTEATVTDNPNPFDFQFNASDSPFTYNFQGLSKKDVIGNVYNNSDEIPARSAKVYMENGNTTDVRSYFLKKRK